MENNHITTKCKDLIIKDGNELHRRLEFYINELEKNGTVVPIDCVCTFFIMFDKWSSIAYEIVEAYVPNRLNVFNECREYIEENMYQSHCKDCLRPMSRMLGLAMAGVHIGLRVAEKE